MELKVELLFDKRVIRPIL